MVEFDAVAYSSAVALFEFARNARKSLPSVIAQIADSVDMLRSPSFDGMPKSQSDGDALERHAIEHIDLMAQLEQSRREYEDVIARCEQAIMEMERSGECADNDGAVLRCYYLQGMSEKATAKKCGYAVSSIYNKREIALVHIAPAVRRLGLIGYSQGFTG